MAVKFYKIVLLIHILLSDITLQDYRYNLIGQWVGILPVRSYMGVNAFNFGH